MYKSWKKVRMALVQKYLIYMRNKDFEAGYILFIYEGLI